MDTNDIKKFTSKLLEYLPERNRDVVSRRFGLKNGDKETLESIGKSYGITRERVRQIEEVSLTNLRNNIEKIKSQAKPFIRIANNILEEHGGIMKENDLFEKFSGNSKATSINTSLVLLMTLDSGFSRSHDTDELHSFWSLSADHIDMAKNAISSLASLLKKNNEPIEQDKLHGFFKTSFNSTVSQKALFAYTALSKNINCNIYGEIGLNHWSDINPKGVRDKAYLVLKKYEKPLHFKDITSLVNNAGFNGRKANVQTVHNELIKDERFVLVGRGIYGLTQWGYKSGTVKDVLAEILKESKKPLTREELVSRVLETRMVKENTITLNLQDSKMFKKLGNGNYTLRKA